MDTAVGGTGAMPARDHADETGESPDGGRSAPSSRRDRHDSRDRRPHGKVKETRRVDLKQALLRLEPVEGEATRGGSLDGASRSSAPAPAAGCCWTMEAWLDHPNGHVANPRVVLEQLFRLSPEEQARVQVTREAILREDGAPLAG